MNAAQSTPRSQPPRRRRIVARRVLALTFIAVACCGAFRLGRLWADWRQVSSGRIVPAAVQAEIEQMNAVLPLDGHWTFAGVDWNFKSRTMATEDVDRELAGVAETLTKAADRSSTVAARELIEYVEQLGLEPAYEDGRRVYRLDRRDVKAVLVVSDGAAGEQSVAAAVACRQDDRTWQVFEFTPQPSTAGSLSVATDLLPLPPGASRNGGRFSDDGRLLMELVTLGDEATSAKDLLAAWNAAGWEVRPSGLAGEESFSYLCRSGETVVYAWSADPGEALRNLMLVRTPAASHTGP